MAEWDALGWDVQRTYLDGMEADESVPLTFGRQGGPVPEEAPGALAGMPDGFSPTVRRAEGADVIDISGMISDLEASRGGGR